MFCRRLHALISKIHPHHQKISVCDSSEHRSMSDMLMNAHMQGSQPSKTPSKALCPVTAVKNFELPCSCQGGHGVCDVHVHQQCHTHIPNRPRAAAAHQGPLQCHSATYRYAALRCHPSGRWSVLNEQVPSNCVYWQCSWICPHVMQLKAAS